MVSSLDGIRTQRLWIWLTEPSCCHSVSQFFFALWLFCFDILSHGLVLVRMISQSCSQCCFAYNASIEKILLFFSQQRSVIPDVSRTKVKMMKTQRPETVDFLKKNLFLSEEYLSWVPCWSSNGNSRLWLTSSKEWAWPAESRAYLWLLDKWSICAPS